MKSSLSSVRKILKRCANGASLVVVAPSVLLCRAARWARPQSEAVFDLFAHCWALAPGRPGMYLRRAFYRCTLDRCAADWHIGFGSQFTHQTAHVESGVYIGSYALIGSAKLGAGCLIGSRASILSGGRQHEITADGKWGPTRLDKLVRVDVGDHCWVGEGAILMADVGPGAMVAAGAVVGTRVPERVMVAGNPARFIRKLTPAAESEPGEKCPSLEAAVAAPTATSGAAP